MTAELLTVDQFREHEETALGDDALQRLLDSNEQAINEHCGELVLGSGDVWQEITEDHYDVVGGSGARLLRLEHTPESITSVSSINSYGNATALLEGDDEDWVQDGQILRRVNYWWGNHTRVVYLPKSRVVQRRALLIQLVKLDINVQPGQGFAGAATWQETFKDYEMEKQHLLWSLCPPPVFS